MCGIAGVWSPHHPDPNQEERIREMVATLAHRGPDGSGVHLDRPLGLAMGHTRLSIIDLSRCGTQPFVDRDNGLFLTVNGEFYEYKRIRGELATEGFRFQSKSDSEIALKLYQKYGADFVHHLRGEFALALFDARRQELILVRDRFGIRPLFFHVGRDAIYYGSEIKSLVAHPRVPRRLSRRGMLHQMMQVMVPGDTLLEEIHALKPGRMLRARRTDRGLDVRQQTYWDAEFPPHGEHRRGKDEDHVERVRQAMVESVGLRLEADVPVACYLSGGLDSCAILGLASNIQQSPVKAFTISFDDDRYDESALAREAAELWGADQDVLDVRASDLYGKNFEKAVWHSERTFYNTLGVAKMLMSEHVTRSGYKVVITGEGSDEIFGGYAAFKRDFFLHDPDAPSPAAERALQASNAVFSGSILAERDAHHPAFHELMGFTPSWIQPWLLTYEGLKGLLSPAFLDSLEGYDPVRAIVESFDPQKLEGRHPLDQAQYTWMKTMLEGQILNWGGDRVDMANSLESRPAFLDHHVVELAITLPPEVRIRNGVEKWVLREAMRHVIPASLYQREKFAFMAPPAHTDRAKTEAVETLVRKHLSRERVQALGMVEEETLADFLAARDGQPDHALQTRRDIILNHLIGVHLLEQQLGSGGYEGGGGSGEPSSTGVESGSR